MAWRWSCIQWRWQQEAPSPGAHGEQQSPPKCLAISTGVAQPSKSSLRYDFVTGRAPGATPARDCKRPMLATAEDGPPSDERLLPVEAPTPLGRTVARAAGMNSAHYALTCSTTGTSPQSPGGVNCC